MNREVSISVRPEYEVKLYNKQGFIGTFDKVPSEVEMLPEPEKMMLDNALEEVWRIRHGVTGVWSMKPKSKISLRLGHTLDSSNGRSFLTDQQDIVMADRQDLLMADFSSSSSSSMLTDEALSLIHI